MVIRCNLKYLNLHYSQYFDYNFFHTYLNGIVFSTGKCKTFRTWSLLHDRLWSRCQLPNWVKKSLIFLQQFPFSYYNIYWATIIISGVNSVSIKSVKKYKMLRGGGGGGGGLRLTIMLTKSTLVFPKGTKHILLKFVVISCIYMTNY